MTRLRLNQTRPRQRTPQSRTGLAQYYQASRASGSQPSRRYRSRGWRALFTRAGRWLIFVLLIGAFAYNLSLHSNPHLLVSSLAYRPTADYEQALNSEFKALTNSNKLTIDQPRIKNNLIAKLPEISEVNFTIPLIGQTPTVKLTIASPSLFLISSGTIYVVDQQGVVVAKAGDLKKINNLPRLEDQSGFRVQIGKPILNASAIDFVNNLITQTKKANLPLASLILPAAAQEIDLRTSDRAYFVKFYLGGDALTQIGQFLASRHNFDAGGPTPSQYLDVRVPGKAYFK